MSRACVVFYTEGKNIKQGFALDVTFENVTLCNWCYNKIVSLLRTREAWNAYTILFFVKRTVLFSVKCDLDPSVYHVLYHLNMLPHVAVSHAAYLGSRRTCGIDFSFLTVSVYKARWNWSSTQRFSFVYRRAARTNKCRFVWFCLPTERFINLRPN